LEALTGIENPGVGKIKRLLQGAKTKMIFQSILDLPPRSQAWLVVVQFGMAT
jgi:hypothetical protein